MIKTQGKYYTTRNKLPKDLEQTLSSVKNFQGEYEYERDYLKVFEKIKNTNPFSVLVFYEYPQAKISLAQRKKLNPYVPERMLEFFASYAQFYFIPELKEMRLGSNPGSGYRSTQSTYALALALFSKKREVPTDILILNQKGIIEHVLSSQKLIVQPHEVVQNVTLEIADKILKDTTKAYGRRNEELIDGIYLVEPKRKKKRKVYKHHPYQK